MSDIFSKLLNVVVSLIVLFMCFPVHESAHAFVAHKLGDDTAKNQGRISLNPFVHLDLMGSLLLIVSSIIGFGFGWAKPVPINPNNFKNRKLGMGLSALAGPVSNFLMALIFMIIYKILYFYGQAKQSEIVSYVALAVSYIIMTNIILAVFNFLPIPPLDGSRIFMLILPEKIYFKIMQYERYIFFVLLALMLFNVLDPVFNALRNGALMVLDFLTGWVDIIMLRIVL